MTYFFVGLACFAIGWAIGKRRKRRRANIPYLLTVRYVETEEV